MKIRRLPLLHALLWLLCLARGFGQGTDPDCQPIPADYCETKEENQNYPNLADCAMPGCKISYVVCSNGNYQILPCPASTAFSPSTGECETPAVKCANIRMQTPPQSSSTASSSDTNEPEATPPPPPATRTRQPAPETSREAEDPDTETVSRPQQRAPAPRLPISVDDLDRADGSNSIPIEDLLNAVDRISDVDDAPAPETSRDRESQRGTDGSNSIPIEDLLNEVDRISDVDDAPAPETSRDRESQRGTDLGPERSPMRDIDEDREPEREIDPAPRRAPRVDDRFADRKTPAREQAEDSDEEEDILSSEDEDSSSRRDCPPRDLTFDIVGELSDSVDLDSVAAVLSNLTETEIDGQSVEYLIRMGASVSEFPVEFTDSLWSPVQNIFKKTILYTNTKWIEESDINVLTVTDDARTVSTSSVRRQIRCPGNIIIFIEAELSPAEKDNFASASDLLDAVSIIEQRSIKKAVPKILNPHNSGFRVPTKLRPYVKKTYSDDFSSTSIMVARVTVTLPNNCRRSPASITRDIQIAMKLGDLQKALARDAGIRGVTPMFGKYSIAEIKDVEISDLAPAPASAPCPGPDDYDYDAILKEKEEEDILQDQEDYEGGVGSPGPTNLIDLPLAPVPKPKHFPNLTVDESTMSIGNSAAAIVPGFITLLGLLAACLLFLL